MRLTTTIKSRRARRLTPIFTLALLAACGPSSSDEQPGVTTRALSQCTGPMPTVQCAYAVCDTETFTWVLEPVEAGTGCAGGGTCNGLGVCTPPPPLPPKHSPAINPPPPPPVNALTTRRLITGVDDFGRTLVMVNQGDIDDPDDDTRTTVTYAQPATGSTDRILSRIATRVVEKADAATGAAIGPLASMATAYDQLPIGTVGRGYVTSESVARSGGGPPDLVAYSATNDALGNRLTTSSTREDGAIRTGSAIYDAFALGILSETTSATNSATLTTTFVLDNESLDVTAITDANGLTRGAIYDGFGRVVLSTVTPPGASEGALAYASYSGFSGGTSQRSVSVKYFTDPVPDASAAGAEGRVSTTYLDAFGRTQRTETDLGSTYNTTMVSERLYDGIGRLYFASDPHPTSQPAESAYGTTHYYGADGFSACIIRGNGAQPYTEVANEANEVYPRCMRHTTSYAFGKAELVISRDPDSTIAGPQFGIENRAYIAANGRIRERETVDASGARLEATTYGYDNIGRTTSQVRYGAPNQLANAATWSWVYDPLGRVQQLIEPGGNVVTRAYSDWGELLSSSWIDGGATRSEVSRYDGRSRLVHHEERTNSTVDAETIRDFAYDSGTQVAPQVVPTYLLGRLVQASGATGSTFYSYDRFGRVGATVYSDTQGQLFVEKSSYHGDGSASALELLLPDTNYVSERVDYTYDSAGRARTASYSDGTSSESLFLAGTIDPFGRVRFAHYAGMLYFANYADTGRRLVKTVTWQSDTIGAHMRQIAFSGDAFDPNGRERSRQELGEGGGAFDPPTANSYDALGRLVSADRGTRRHSFSYDPLGNLLSLGSINTPVAGGGRATTTTLTPCLDDRDRICSATASVDGAGSQTGSYTYDARGRLRHQTTFAADPTATTPTLTKGYRDYTYYNDGSIRSITDDKGSSARFRYSAMGEVQELDVVDAKGVDARTDRRYGGLIERHTELVAGAPQSVTTRKIPGPHGFMATRHGATGAWSFSFGDAVGVRSVSDDHGNFVQDLAYTPYGAVASTGSSGKPGQSFYSHEQWNGGDALATFGLVHLGARVYDPAIGRFLTRDPIVQARSATDSNPYAFAINDPVNYSDPSGLDIGLPPRMCYGIECEGLVNLGVTLGTFAIKGLADMLPHLFDSGPTRAKGLFSGPPGRWAVLVQEPSRAAEEHGASFTTVFQVMAAREDAIDEAAAYVGKNVAYGVKDFAVGSWHTGLRAAHAYFAAKLGDSSEIDSMAADMARGMWQLVRHPVATVCHVNCVRGLTAVVLPIILGSYGGAAGEAGAAAREGAALAEEGAAAAAAEAEGAAAGGAARTMIDPNRLNHIFGKAEHALDDFVEASGGREAAFRRIQDAANAALREGRLTTGPNGILPRGNAGHIIDVGGTPIRLIGGRIIDGAVEISSASRMGLP